MDDRRFDELSRRVGALALPRLPRRGVLGFLGVASLAGTLGVALEPQLAAAAKCKDEGKKCDKKKCKKKDKKCCCKNLKCKNGRCEAKGPTCLTDADFADEWINFDSTPGPDTFNAPWGIDTDPDGNVYVTDRNNERVLVFNRNGGLRDEFGEEGEGGNEFDDPRGIGFNLNNNDNERLYVADPLQNDNDDRIRRFIGDLNDQDFGSNSADLGEDTGENDISPFGVAIDPDNRVWVVNQSVPGLIFLFDRNGGFVATFEPDLTASPGDDVLDDPEGIAVFEDDDGNDFVFVADTDHNRIIKFEHVSNDRENGLEYVTEVGNSDGSSGNGNREFSQPTGLDVDECGNVWVADTGNNRISVFNKKLEFIDNFTSSLDQPTGVALGPDEDVLYVTDSANNRVVVFDLT